MISISASNTRDAQIWNGIPMARTPKCGNTEYPNDGSGLPSKTDYLELVLTVKLNPNC